MMTFRGSTVNRVYKLVHKNLCTENFKMALFKAYCTPLHTAHLLCCYTKAKFNKQQVHLTKTLRILLKVPPWTSASLLFVQNNASTLNALTRNVGHKFMMKLIDSQNDAVNVLKRPDQSSVRHSSVLWRHCRKCLYGLKLILCCLFVLVSFICSY